MKKPLVLVFFLLYNFVYSQVNKKNDEEYIYKNIRIKNNNQIQECQCEAKFTYNFDNVHGDILLQIKNIYYHFKKSSKFKKGITSYDYKYKYAEYISENGNKVTIQFFDNNNQGIRFILSENEEIWIH